MAGKRETDDWGGEAGSLPSLKNEAWGTHSFVDGQTWDTCHPIIYGWSDWGRPPMYAKC